MSLQKKKLSHFIKKILPENYPEKKNLTELLKIITETCIPIRRLLEKGVSSRELSYKYSLSEDSMKAGINPSGEEQIHEDQLTHSIFLKTIQESDIPYSFIASEEADPILGNGILGITIDPVDGSSNVVVNRTVGTIIGIWLQEQLIASMYILYGVFTNLVLCLNRRVSEFILSKDNSSVNYNHFVYINDLKLPDVDKSGYRCIGGNAAKWHQKFKDYHHELIKKGYKDRYSGSFVGDAHAILYKGGVYGYFPAPKGKLRLYYEWLPVAFIFENIGGKFLIIEMENDNPVIKTSNDVTPLLKSNVTTQANTVCGGIVGNKKTINLFEKIMKK
ncbi:MAG: hypothetical protein ACTSWN_06435 [Promethearchaeota archaeon]